MPECKLLTLVRLPPLLLLLLLLLRRFSESLAAVFPLLLVPFYSSLSLSLSLSPCKRKWVIEFDEIEFRWKKSEKKSVYKKKKRIEITRDKLIAAVIAKGGNLPRPPPPIRIGREVREVGASYTGW